MSIRGVHERELERFRSSMNLVGPGALEFHFEDCVMGLSGLELTGIWADLGSGAGFPGLVMADLFPDLEVHLVESRQKRATFLRHVVMTADADHIMVLHQRVQTLPNHTYDGVVSRAFASPHDVLIHADRLLKPQSGKVILFLQADAGWNSPPGWALQSTRTYNVNGKQRRSVLLHRS